MQDIVTTAALAMLALAAVLAFIRLLRGPTLPDRVVALDLIGVLIVCVIVTVAADHRPAGLPRRRDRHRAGQLRRNGRVRAVTSNGRTRVDRMARGKLLPRRSHAGAPRRGRHPAHARRVYTDAGVHQGLDSGTGMPAGRAGDSTILTRRSSYGPPRSRAFMMLTTAVAAHVIARAAARSGAPLWKGTLLDERPVDRHAARRCPSLTRGRETPPPIDMRQPQQEWPEWDAGTDGPPSERRPEEPLTEPVAPRYSHHHEVGVDFRGDVEDRLTGLTGDHPRLSHDGSPQPEWPGEDALRPAPADFSVIDHHRRPRHRRTPSATHTAGRERPCLAHRLARSGRAATRNATADATVKSTATTTLLNGPQRWCGVRPSVMAR